MRRHEEQAMKFWLKQIAAGIAGLILLVSLLIIGAVFSEQ